MKNKKIGILTFHHTTNYGATLQAYSLWEVIRQQGYNVEIIDYRPEKAIAYYQREINKIKTDKYYFLKYKKLICLFNLLMKANKFEAFINKTTKVSKAKKITRETIGQIKFPYDIIISGSDQVWCLDSYRGFDPSFFLDFASDSTVTKISYAPSFNTTNQLGKHKEIVCNLLKKFDFVSVRDSHSLSLIKDECGIAAQQVLDPTFLLDFSKEKIEPKIREKYLLIYCQDSMSLAQENFIKSIATSKKLLIVSVGNKHRVAQKNYISIDPKEWIGYFSKASYVVTNTYHGTIFAIKFNKQFSTFYNENKRRKTGDLLKQINLLSRFLDVEDKCSVKEQDNLIDYNSVNKILQKEVAQSREYLLSSLS